MRWPSGTWSSNAGRCKCLLSRESEFVCTGIGVDSRYVHSHRYLDKDTRFTHCVRLLAVVAVSSPSLIKPGPRKKRELTFAGFDRRNEYIVFVGKYVHVWVSVRMHDSRVSNASPRGVHGSRYQRSRLKRRPTTGNRATTFAIYR